ncbi:MAG: hypothetical protein LBC29_05425, partial [Propionibacteriaceae bacterium]|nr:hypothetical protein [Propionibacteriaceae bacterium]
AVQKNDKKWEHITAEQAAEKDAEIAKLADEIAKQADELAKREAEIAQLRAMFGAGGVQPQGDF